MVTALKGFPNELLEAVQIDLRRRLDRVHFSRWSCPRQQAVISTVCIFAFFIGSWNTIYGLCLFHEQQQVHPSHWYPHLAEPTLWDYVKPMTANMIAAVLSPYLHPVRASDRGRITCQASRDDKKKQLTFTYKEDKTEMKCWVKRLFKTSLCRGTTG